MSYLNFKNWLFNEIADYGFGKDQIGKPQGGIEDIKGDTPFHPVNPGKIIHELTKMPTMGPINVSRKWSDSIEFGEGSGAIKVLLTPYGSMRVVIRQQINDLLGEETWICRNVLPLDDNEAINHEISIAQDVFNEVRNISLELLPHPLTTFNDFERLSWKLWQESKRRHPSYIMFPVAYRKQNENYHKLVYEFRGHGVVRQINTKPSRAEQFNIDLVWDHKKGLIHCWGYNIDSTLGQHSWKVQPSVFDEWFAPSQNIDSIINSVITTFMQY